MLVEHGLRRAPSNPEEGPNLEGSNDIHHWGNKRSIVHLTTRYDMPGIPPGSLNYIYDHIWYFCHFEQFALNSAMFWVWNIREFL